MPTEEFFQWTGGIACIAQSLIFLHYEFCILHFELDAGDGARGEGPPEFGLFGSKRIIIAAWRLWWRVESFEYFEFWNNNNSELQSFHLNPML